jgi:hypothetical protein
VDATNSSPVTNRGGLLRSRDQRRWLLVVLPSRSVSRQRQFLIDADLAAGRHPPDRVPATLSRRRVAGGLPSEAAEEVAGWFEDDAAFRRCCGDVVGVEETCLAELGAD